MKTPLPQERRLEQKVAKGAKVQFLDTAIESDCSIQKLNWFHIVWKRRTALIWSVTLWHWVGHEIPRQARDDTLLSRVSAEYLHVSSFHILFAGHGRVVHASGRAHLSCCQCEM